MSTIPNFDQDLKDLHLIYDYHIAKENGKADSWRYELWFSSETRVVYAVHGGPMAGRLNYQKAYYQCIRPGEIWQISWLEETGTIISMVVDLKNETVTSLGGFSRGHWDNPTAAHGDKRNPEDFERWRALANVGKGAADREMLAHQARIKERFYGRGELGEVDESWPTL